MRAYVLLTTWDGSEAHRSSPEEGQDTHMGLVGKTRCPQMHGVSLSAQYSAGKGDEVPQQCKVAQAATHRDQELASKAPSPGGSSKQGCGYSSSVGSRGKSNLALLVLVRVGTSSALWLSLELLQQVRLSSFPCGLL